MRHRHENLSSAIADLITRALDAGDLGDNVPATKAEELEQIREMRDLVDEIGRGVFAPVRPDERTSRPRGQVHREGIVTNPLPGCWPPTRMASNSLTHRDPGTPRSLSWRGLWRRSPAGHNPRIAFSN